MSTSAIVILAYAGAACGGAMALIAALRGWRSISVWFFVIGMLLLAAESAFSGLALDTPLVDEAAGWHHWRLITMALLPSVWMLFSLSYARGTYRDFFRQWRFVLAGSLVVPVVVVCACSQGSLIIPPDDGIDKKSLEWIFQLRAGGFVLYAVFLISAVMVLMNLERTFRAAVGTMRWRIKFMILGLVILFAVRAYTCSQVLLRQKIDPSLIALNCGALVLGCLLSLRSLFRDVSEVAVFPSRAVLENSFTALVAGVYLVCIAILFKVAAWVESFEAKAFIFLAVLVAGAAAALSDRVRLHTPAFYQPLFSAAVL